MISIRFLVIGCAIAASALFSPNRAEAGLCGFAGAVSAGANSALGPGNNNGWVVLFDEATLLQNGIASVRLGSDYGKACMDIWRDGMTGPGVVNFNVVYAPAAGNPAVCAANGCAPAGLGAICNNVTLCTAFPD